MRLKQYSQSRFVIPASNLKVTNKFFEQYDRISEILDSKPEILELIHNDLKVSLKYTNKSSRNGTRKRFRYTSENVLRIIICRKLECLSYRDIVIRIDDSKKLREFTRIYEKPMMDFTTLNKLENSIRTETWNKINQYLTEWAFGQKRISGESLRLDTTAVETNIHYPTDSWLLWDLYRVLARSIEAVREIDSEAVGKRRLQIKKVKRLQFNIARAGGKKKKSLETLKPSYEKLMGHARAICDWSREVVCRLVYHLEQQLLGFFESIKAEALVAQMNHFLSLAPKVIDQAHRRVILGEKVPNDDKIFSIFEEHTELLIRGKAHKDVEFGHMVLIGQVSGKFITQYEVFDRRPVEHQLLGPVLDAHRKTFNAPPRTLAADKGFYENMDAVTDLEKDIDTVAIAKKGKRNTEETKREHADNFRWGQRFRAGVEGTISYLKRVFGMFRVLRKGYEHFVAEIGAAVFAHNLLILTRS